MHRQKEAESAVVRGGRRTVPRLAIVILLPALVWSLAACGGGSGGGGSADTGTTSLQVAVSIPGSSVPANFSPLAPKGVFTDVQSVLIEVYAGVFALPIPGGETPIASAFLQQDTGTDVWSGIVPDLPLGTTLTFVGRAYNVDAEPDPVNLAIPDNEIFNGSAIAALSGINDTLSLALSPIDDGTGIALPSITRITVPAEIKVDTSATVEVAVSGRANEFLDFAFVSGGGTFTLASGFIQLNGGIGTITASYTSPATGTFPHTVTVTNRKADGSPANSVTQSFDTVVVLAVGSGDITVLFNPVVTAISAVHSPAVLTLTFTATVSDDVIPLDVTYQWGFSGSGRAGIGIVQSTNDPEIATLVSYDDTADGTVTLIVTDQGGTGGFTQVTFDLPAFPVITLFQDVALFANTTYVDYDPAFEATGAEASNLQKTLELLGYTVNTFTGIAADDINAAVDRRGVLAIPELESGSLDLNLTAEARAAMRSFVERDGGTLMVFLPATNVINLLNNTFGLTLSGGGIGLPFTLNASDAAGTAFADSPASLPSNLFSTGVTASTLPAGARIIYISAEGNSVVTLIPFGAGEIIIFGWDWNDAKPTGAQDGGWLKALDRALLREVTLNAVDKGWWNDNGDHISTNQNTFTGWNGIEANSYFTYDVSGIGGTVTSATLRLELLNYSSPDDSETVSMWDVTTDPAVLDSDATGNVAVFNDLQSGLSYGEFTVLSTDVGTVLEIPLNAQAISDLNATTDAFSVGLHLKFLGQLIVTEGMSFSDVTGVGEHQLRLRGRSGDQPFVVSHYTLSVGKTGNGTVFSNPSGIDCGTACSASYEYNTAVTLTATPDTGNVFSGWSGACTGTDACNVIMSADQAVTATFTIQP